MVSGAGVKRVVSLISATPDDHLTACPNCRVQDPRRRCTGSAHSCPTIGAGIISPAGVPKRKFYFPTPDNHFRASPHRCVKLSAIGRSSGRRPGTINASCTFQYFRQLVGGTRCCGGGKYLVLCAT